MPSEAQAKISRWMPDQAGWCRRLGSELYVSLLDHAAGDIEDGGPCWQALEEHSSDPARSLLPLRFLGAVHRLVLEGRATALARYYPSVGGDPRAPGAWEAFRETVREQQEALRKLIPHPVQTNEVGRCVALLGGFLLVAKTTGLPLRLFAIGA